MEEETNKITRFDQTITIKQKENNISIIDNVPKSVKGSVEKKSQQEPFYIKAVKLNYDNKVKSDESRSPNNEANETKDNSQVGEEPRNSVEKQWEDGEITFQAELKSRQASEKDSVISNESGEKRPRSSHSSHKKASSENMEFTLGVFTPEKKVPQFGVAKGNTLAPEVNRENNAGYVSVFISLKFNSNRKKLRMPRTNLQ